MMDNYIPEDATEAAMNIKNEIPINRMQEVESKFEFKNRYPISDSIKPFKGRKIKLDVRGKHTILMGAENIELSQVEQLMDSSQTRAIAYAIYHASQFYMDNRSMKSWIC